MVINIPITIIRTTSPLTRALDCWNDSETCVVCGNGGCFSFEYSSAGVYKFLKHFYHKKFYFVDAQGINVYDHVYDVKVLRTTTYFFSIESMKGDNSAGLIRWDTTKSNCYVNYTGKFEDNNREYYLEPVRYTRNILVSSPGSRRLLVFNVADITVPVNQIMLQSTPNLGKISAFTR